MDEHIHNPLLLRTTTIATICLFFLTTFPQYSRCQEDENKYLVCRKAFNCGGLTNIHYPFWLGEYGRPRYCGGSDQFKLNCEPYPRISLASQDFHVWDVNPITYTMKMVRFQPDDFNYDVCNSRPLTNISLDSNLFKYTQSVHNITIFYNCPHGFSYGGNNITCQDDGNHLYAFYGNETLLEKYPGLQECKVRIQVHALWDVPLVTGGGIDYLRKALEGGFEVNYTTAVGEECKRCQESNGICGRNDTDTYQFSCHCPDGSDTSSQCPAPAPARARASARAPAHAPDNTSTPSFPFTDRFNEFAISLQELKMNRRFGLAIMIWSLNQTLAQSQLASGNL